MAVARAATVAVARAATVAVAVARAATVAVAVEAAFDVGVPVDGDTPPVPKSDKKRLLFERSELRTLPDFVAGGVGSLRAARIAIFGVAFSRLRLLAKQKR